MDELDRAIAHALEDDGRRSMREIARELDVAEATVRTRLKRLRDEGILRVVAFVDPEQFGDRQLALMSLSVDPARHAEIVDELVAMPETSYVSTVLGEPDIVCEVQCADNHALWRLLNERVSALPGVRAVRTQPVVVVHKLKYGGGV